MVVHNGTPGSRLLFRRWIEDAEARGIRLIGYDRPGYGGSTPHPGRSVSDAARDVASIVDYLGIDRFLTWGVSGGGPHALACAALLPSRLIAAASLASVAPHPAPDLEWFAGMGEDNVAEFGAALKGRASLEAFLARESEAVLGSDLEATADALRSLLSPVDAEALTTELGDYLLAVIREGIARRIDGWLDDDLAFVKPWGFELRQVSVPVLLWHGVHDRFVPLAHGEWLSKRVNAVEARFSESDGHLTLSARRVPEVHKWLLDRWAAASAG
ncbi:MAG: alpha/beta hydrolase [Chloroflexota bacterium]|nr:alpha/beta hydrolase [Chloroflexota bacterium]